MCPCSTEVWKNIFESIALILAAAYFLFRFISGYFIVNLVLQTSAKREKLNDSEDVIVVKAEITKGDRGTVAIHDAAAKLTFQDNEKGTQIRTFKGIHRQSFDTKNNKMQITWDRESEGNRKLNIAPGEATSFETFFRVPKSEICEIEISILGKRHISQRVSQWKSSIISLPISIVHKQ